MPHWASVAQTSGPKGSARRKAPSPKDWPDGQTASRTWKLLLEGGEEIAAGLALQLANADLKEIGAGQQTQGEPTSSTMSPSRRSKGVAALGGRAATARAAGSGSRRKSPALPQGIGISDYVEGGGATCRRAPHPHVRAPPCASKARAGNAAAAGDVLRRHGEDGQRLRHGRRQSLAPCKAREALDDGGGVGDPAIAAEGADGPHRGAPACRWRRRPPRRSPCSRGRKRRAPPCRCIGRS